MSNPNPSPNTRFKPGETGNPQGRSLESAEVRKIRKLTNDEIAEVGTMLLDNNRAELEAIVKDPSTPVLRLMIASVVATAMKKGDAGAMNILLDRMAGKIKQEVKHSGEIKNTGMTAAEVNDTLRDPETRKLALELAERIADQELEG